MVALADLEDAVMTVLVVACYGDAAWGKPMALAARKRNLDPAEVSEYLASFCFCSNSAFTAVLWLPWRQQQS